MPSVLPSVVQSMSTFDVSDTVVPTTTPSCSDLAASANLTCLTNVPVFVVVVIGDDATLVGTGVVAAAARDVNAGVPKRRRCDFVFSGVVPNIMECIVKKFAVPART